MFGFPVSYSPCAAVASTHRLFPWVMMCLIGALTACSDPKDSDIQAEQPRTVVDIQTLTLELQDWTGSIETFGSVEATEEIQLSLDFSATVAAVLVDEGEKVVAGQPLINMEQEKPALRLRQANELALQGKAALDEAFNNLKRRQRLAELETISEEILDNAKLAVRRARANYRQAVASRQLAEKELAESRITSPVKGVVDIRAVETGQSVPAGSTLMVLQATSALQVKTWVSEKDVALISKGASARIELNSRPGSSLTGKIKSIGINGHPSTGNFPVEVIIEDNLEMARPGMTATVEIQELSIPGILLLPEAALVDRNRKRVVYRLVDGIAHAVEPLLSAGLSDQIVVLSGLSPGDKLIISNLESIIDGSQVRSTDTH